MRLASTLILAAQVACAADVVVVGQEDEDMVKVTAGKEITVKVTNAKEIGSGYDPDLYEATHIQIGVLSMITASWMCSLTDYLPAKDGTYKVTVPPEIGPSGAYYKIGAGGYQIEEGSFPMGLVDGKRTGIVYLSGGESQWVPAETVPEQKYYGLNDFQRLDIPCKSFACARECADKEYPGANGWANGTVWVDCLSECDDVRFNWAEITDSTVTVDVPKSLATPTGECKQEDFDTPCNKECCSSYEYCLFWEACAPLPLRLPSGDDEASTTTSAAGPTGTPNPNGGSENEDGGDGDDSEGSGSGDDGEGSGRVLNADLVVVALTFLGMTGLSWMGLI